MKKKLMYIIGTVLASGIVVYGLVIIGVLLHASSYKPERDVVCSAMTQKARHDLTGIVKVFPNSCIPEGWEQVDS